MMKNKDKTITFLVGLPCSGKSTWCSNLTEDHIRLSSDKFIEEEAEKLGKTYNDVFFGYIKDASKKFHSEKQFQLTKHHPNIIVDRTNLYVASRNSILASVPKKEYYVKAIVFDVSLKTILKRNKERQKIGKFIPEDILKEMFETKQFDKTKDFSGFDEVQFINESDVK